jgi:hypothetical protein
MRLKTQRENGFLQKIIPRKANDRLQRWLHWGKTAVWGLKR